MNETTNTYDNLLTIYLAMKKIKEIDRSNNFYKYYIEVQDRMNEIIYLNYIMNKNDRN